MTPTQLRNSILQTAITGALVPQNPDEGSAEQLLQQIEDEKRRLIAERNAAKIAAARAAGKSETEIKKIKLEKYTAPKPVNPDEFPFEIPKNWRWVRLGDVGEMFRGNGIKRDETTEKGKPCIRYGEIYTSFIYVLDEPKSFVSDSLFERCRKIHKGDLVFTLTGENKEDIAKTLAYQGDEIIAAGGDLAVWTNHCCNEKFLSYAMYSPLMISQKSNVATGDIIVHISAEKIGNLLLPLPPLPEQRRIVAKLEEILPLVEEYGEAQTELEILNAALPDKLKKSLLQQAITGRLVPQTESDGSAEQLLLQIEDEKRRLIAERNAAKIAAARAAGKSAAEIKKIKLEKYTAPTPVNPDDAPFEIPQSWRWTKLDWFINFKSGSTEKIENIKDDDWILDLEDIEKESGKILRKKTYKEIKSKSDKHSFKKGNVLYSKLRPYLNKVVIPDADGYCTSEILCFDFGLIYNRYAQFFLMSPYFVSYAMDGAYGTKMPRANADACNNAFFPLPPLPEQRRIVAKLEEMFAEIEKLR